MTKITIIGEETRNKKPIELKLLLCDDLSFDESPCKGDNYSNIELICRNYGVKGLFDLIYAYDSDRNKGYLYLGHWNDGVLE